jgi:hypothetical protein
MATKPKAVETKAMEKAPLQLQEEVLHERRNGDLTHGDRR